MQQQNHNQIKQLNFEMVDLEMSMWMYFYHTVSDMNNLRFVRDFQFFRILENHGTEQEHKQLHRWWCDGGPSFE